MPSEQGSGTEAATPLTSQPQPSQPLPSLAKPVVAASQTANALPGAEAEPVAAPAADFDYDAYAHEPPFRPRRNPARMRTIYAIAVAAALFSIGGAVAWYGPARVMALFGFGSAEFDVPLLIMAKVESPRSQASGAVVLPVSGRIVNPTDIEQPLYDILVEMRDVQGRVVYTWTIPRPMPTIGARRSASFDSATVNPPKNAVKLKFLFIGAK